MKKQLVIIGIVAILVSVGLSGCSQVTNPLNSDKNKFVGTWFNSTVFEGVDGHYHYSNTTITFLSDGTVSSGFSSGTWELRDGKLVTNVHALDIDAIIVYNYTFSNNERTVSLTDVSNGKTEVYTKQ